MAKTCGSGAGGPATKETSRAKVWSISPMPACACVRETPSNEALMEELDEVRSLLDQGLSAEAHTRLTSLITAARNNPSILALARCALSTALEMQGHYRESLAAVAMYESPESHDQTRSGSHLQSCRVQIGLAYNYNGDHPKAISILKGALARFFRKRTRAKLGSNLRGSRSCLPKHQ